MNSMSFWGFILLLLEGTEEERFEVFGESISKRQLYFYSSQNSNLKLQQYLEAIQIIQLELIVTSGRSVEDVLYACAQRLLYEHPAHSHILNPADFAYNLMFSGPERSEIVASQDADLLTKPLPLHFKNILTELNAKMSFNEIYQAIDSVKAHPLHNSEEYWLKQSIITYTLILMNGNTIPKYNTEKDLLGEVYSAIKMSRMISNTTTETASSSASSSESKNESRTIATAAQEARQTNAEHADLVFKYLSNEIACVEVGLTDHGPNGSKELNEREMKTPLMLRCLHLRMLSQYKIQIPGVKMIGFTISGHYISAMVMDFRHGSTALLTTSKRFKMPESLEEIPLLLPHVLKLLYNCSLITRSTVASIKLSTNTFNEDEEGHFLPPCFRPVEKSDKKRKR